MYAMKDNPDFSMLVGPEEIMAESVLLGAHGGVNGGANMFPELYVSLYNAAKNSRYGRSETFAGKSNANQCYDIYGRATWVQLPERSEMCSQSTWNMQRLCGCAFP